MQMAGHFSFSRCLGRMTQILGLAMIVVGVMLLFSDVFDNATFTAAYGIGCVVVGLAIAVLSEGYMSVIAINHNLDQIKQLLALSVCGQNPAARTQVDDILNDDVYYHDDYDEDELEDESRSQTISNWTAEASIDEQPGDLWQKPSNEKQKEDPVAVAIDDMPTMPIKLDDDMIRKCHVCGCPIRKGKNVCPACNAKV